MNLPGKSLAQLLQSSQKEELLQQGINKAGNVCHDLSNMLCILRMPLEDMWQHHLGLRRVHVAVQLDLHGYRNVSLRWLYRWWIRQGQEIVSQAHWQWAFLKACSSSRP